MSRRSPRISWPHWLKGTTWQEGTKGKERSSRSHGTTTVKSGKSGITVPARPRGEKGDKGGTWPKVMPGATGGPGKTAKTSPKKSTGEKKDMREPRPKSMPGPTESPRKSISAPQVKMPSADQTRDEGHNVSSYCRAGGNPTPSVQWRLKGRKRLSGAKYLVKEGELVVRNLNYNDTGQYTCATKNILGSSKASDNDGSK